MKKAIQLLKVAVYFVAAIAAAGCTDVEPSFASLVSNGAKPWKVSSLKINDITTNATAYSDFRLSLSLDASGNPSNYKVEGVNDNGIKANGDKPNYNTTLTSGMWEIRPGIEIVFDPNLENVQPSIVTMKQIPNGKTLVLNWMAPEALDKTIPWYEMTLVPAQ